MVSITAGDGKPYDFVVTINSEGDINESYLRSLIDRYKLYGRRYRIARLAYTTDIKYTEHTCERVDATIEIKCTNYVCELDEHTAEARFVNHVCEKVVKLIDCQIGCLLTNRDSTIIIASQYPVVSTVRVTVSGGGVATLILTLNKGETTTSVTGLIGEYAGWQIHNISPQTDDTYIYKA